MKVDDMAAFFNEEIDIKSFKILDEFCIEFLILCKLACGNVNLSHNGSPLKLCICPTPNEELELQNTILISKKRHVDESHYQKDLSFFMNQYKTYFHSEISVYVDEENRLAEITMEGDVRCFSSTGTNIIMAVLPRLLPWYFAESFPKEMKQNMAKLIAGDRDYFRRRLDVMIEECGMKQKIMLKKIDRISTRLVDSRIETIDADIQSYNYKIKTMLGDIAKMATKQRELQAERETLESQAENAKKPVLELVDFIQNSNENISIESIQGTVLNLSIVTEMSVFQDEEYQGYVVNNKGDSYFFTETTHPQEEIRLLCKAIFEQRKIKVFFVSEIAIDLKTGLIEGGRRQTLETLNAIPHPHLSSGFFCMGNNVEYIAQYVRDLRLVEAINCVIYSAKQFTIGDSYAGKHFLENIFVHPGLQMPNGEFMNANKAIQYMKEHKEEFDD